MIRQECRLKQLGLDYGSPRDFVVSRWERDRVSGSYITYRFVVAGFLFSILVANGSTDTRPELWFIYLTDLGLLTQTLHLVLSAALTVQYLLRFKKGSEDRMTLLAKCSWVLYNVTNITTLLITVVYWAFIYNPEKGLDAMNFMIHAVNSIVCLIDMFVGARPYRLLHFYQPTIALTVYFIFTVIYWAAGGLNASGQNYIYAILDWNKPKQTTPLVILGLIFLLPFFHALLWSLHKLRDRQWSRFYKWQRNDRVSGWFVIYRSLLVAFSLCIVLSSFFIYGWNYWFIYLTDLGILGQLAHLTISAASSISRLFIEREEATDDLRASGIREGEAKMTALDRTSWVFYNMATNSSIVITVIYWTAIYDSVNGIDTMDFMVHAVNTIISLVDLVVSARPWRLLHFYQAILAMALYVIFSIIYWAAGGVNMNGYPYIYSILDWNDPIPTVITIVIAAVAMIPLHAILWVLHLLRDYVSNLVAAKMLPRHSVSPSVAYDNPIFTKVVE